MTNSPTDERFRQAAEAENGMPISAGVRLGNMRPAIDSGRVMFVDLSAVPEEKRPEVIAEINQCVSRAKERYEALDASTQSKNNN